MSGCETHTDITYLQKIEKKLEKNPHDLKNLLKKAVLLYEPFHRAEEGAKILEFIIKQDPCYGDAYMWLGEILSDHLCQEEKAEEVLQAGLIIDPKHAGCHTILGWLMLSRLDKASEFHYQEAIKAQPTWLRPRLCLVYYLLKIHEYKKAKEEVCKALQYIPDEILLDSNPITRHYENFITGRHALKMKDKFLEALKEANEKINEEALEAI